MVKSSCKKIVTALVIAALVAACSSKETPDVTNNNGGSTTENNTNANNAYGNGIAQGSIEDFRQNVGDRVFFSTADYTLSDEAKNTLSSQAMWLKKYAANRSITIEGHADERGTREYNMALGARRANSVRTFLASQGLPVSQFNTVSYGKERPAVEGSDAQAWAQNRRVVVTPQ